MLHGEIKVNNFEIVEWVAVRKENHGGDTHRYECRVLGRTVTGEPFRKEFDVYHSYRKGALYLASTILAEAYHSGVK